MKHHVESTHSKISRQLSLAGGCVVIVYWLIESAVHSLWFEEGPFFTHVFNPDAHEIWMRFIVAVLLLIFIFYCHNIISRLHQTKAELKEREKEALAILENNPAAIILLDTVSRKISYANRNAQEILGLPLNSLTGRPCHSFFCRNQEGRCPVLDLHQEVDTSEMELITAAGANIPILKSITRVQYNNRQHLLETFFDITEQKKMQQAIQEAHSELDQIFQTASVGMRLIDRDYNVLKVNGAFSSLCGISPGSAVGRKCYDIFAGNMCHGATCPLRMVLGGQKLKEYEVTKIRADGSILTCSLTAAPFEGPDGLLGIVEAFKDISELKRTQYQLQAERDRLHNILFHQFEGVGIITEQYVVEYKNEILKHYTRENNHSFCYGIFRYSEYPCRDCVMQKAFETEEIQRCEFETANGRSFEYTYTPFLDIDRQRKVLISQRDITEEKASKAAALSSERLAGLGELAAGVAHEINNPINGIINYAQILMNKTVPESQLNRISERIIMEGDRIAGIVASLLSFSRHHNENREMVAIQDLLHEVLTLTGAQLRQDNIQLSVTCAEGIPPVFAIPHEIVQVFLNLINNSRYSLNERCHYDVKEKRLEIDISRHAGEGGEAQLRMIFTDNGTGIPAGLLERVLNPFFSTKPKGKGTGLGLTISHRIIENHNGSFQIESITNNFTKVTITLPAHFHTVKQLCHEKEYTDS